MESEFLIGTHTSSPASQQSHSAKQSGVLRLCPHLINTFPLSTAKKSSLLNVPKQGSELHGFLSFTQLVLSESLGDSVSTKHTWIPLGVAILSGP